VMVTLRFEDHIGRVEWVTCHVPESQSVVGGVKLLGVGRGDVVGGRRVICCAAMVAVTDTDTDYTEDHDAENGYGSVCRWCVTIGEGVPGRAALKPPL